MVGRAEGAPALLATGRVRELPRGDRDGPRRRRVRAGAGVRRPRRQSRHGPHAPRGALRGGQPLGRADHRVGRRVRGRDGAHRVSPRWLGWGSALVALAHVPALFALSRTGAFSPTGGFAELGPIVFLAWLLCVSVTLLVGRRELPAQLTPGGRRGRARIMRPFHAGVSPSRRSGASARSGNRRTRCRAQHGPRRVRAPRPRQ